MDENKTLDQLISEARQLLAKGDYPGALASALVATEVDPKSEAAWLLRARASDKMGDVIDALEHVLAINPQNPQAREELNFRRIATLREGVYDKYKGTDLRSLATFRERLAAQPFLNPRFVRVFAVAGLILGIGAVLAAAGAWYVHQTRTNAELRAADQFQVSAQRPATWTPSPTATLTPTPKPATNTPTLAPTATPSLVFVPGKTKVNANVRAGPSADFAIVARLAANADVKITGITEDGNYYQIFLADAKRGWVIAGLVQISGGEAAGLPIVVGPPPPPRPVVRATATATPLPPPVIAFVLVKSEPRRNCDRWYVEGTIWEHGYGNGFVPGTQVRVWVNNVIYDTATAHYDRNPAYWEVNFPKYQAVSGLVGVVDATGRLLSQQQPFALTADCAPEGSVNEVVIDFSH